MTEKEKAVKIITGIISLTTAEKNTIKAHLTPEKYKKGTLFLKAGTKNSTIGYLTSGLMRSFSYDEDGEEITTNFIEKGMFFTDLDSFRLGIKSQKSIEALTDCELVGHRKASTRYIEKRGNTLESF